MCITWMVPGSQCDQNHGVTNALHYLVLIVHANARAAWHNQETDTQYEASK